MQRIWNSDLDPSLVVVGGVDLRGWARACQIPGERADLLEGEYRDRATWYRGRFQLRNPSGEALPLDVLERYYLSHFSPGEGLVMYPIIDPAPPVQHLLLVPLDSDGYASLP